MNLTLINDGYISVPGFLDPAVADYLWQYLKFAAMVDRDHDQGHSGFVPGSLGNRANDLAFEALSKQKLADVNRITGLQLIPTYSFSRVYTTGNRLDPHTDRPACEVSVTVKLGQQGEGRSDIVMGDRSIVMHSGDAVIYLGCNIVHSRPLITSPNYYLGQVFLHYIDSHGENQHHKWDGLEKKSRYFLHDIDSLRDK